MWLFPGKVGLAILAMVAYLLLEMITNVALIRNYLQAFQPLKPFNLALLQVWFVWFVLYFNMCTCLIDGSAFPRQLDLQVSHWDHRYLSDSFLGTYCNRIANENFYLRDFS